jgi:hypothetical protein
LQKLFYELVGAGIDHGLVVTTEDLTRRSKPVLAVEGLYNWIGRDPHKDSETELAELGADCCNIGCVNFGRSSRPKQISKPPGYKKLAIKERKRKRRIRREARRASKRTADVILSQDKPAPAPTPGAVTIV